MGRYRRIVIGVIACAIFISCAAGTAFTSDKWGKIIPDTEVRKAFESYQVSPDMNYYISGSDVYPNAILGLNKAYILDSTLWKKVDMTSAKLQELVEDMKMRALGFWQMQFGFEVLDNRGKKIGIWYSLLSAATTIKMEENNKVMIYTPDYNTYERYEEGPAGRIH